MLTHSIGLKRVYDAADKQHDGVRLLADRLWPRGLKKSDLHYDQWIKDLCPSSALRKAWHSQQIDFASFKQRYTAELHQQKAALQEIAVLLQHDNITLLTATKIPENSHLPVLKAQIAACAEQL